MSGPPYPPGPLPGSNAIGSFTIGVSPLGTIKQFQYRMTEISQYANSSIIDALIDNLSAYIDQTQNFDAFYDNIWNVNTAVGIGLDIWGRIVGVTRNLTIAVGNWFGFAEALPGPYTFGQGAFYSGATLTSTYALSDNAFRTLIFAKAMANITNGSITAINAILRSLFPHRGNCYVIEGILSSSWFGFAESRNAQPFGQAPFYSGSPTLTGMQMSYVFQFALSPVEIAIVEQSGVLPKPTGVAASFFIL
jgi:hypothetical protein